MFNFFVIRKELLRAGLVLKPGNFNFILNISGSTGYLVRVLSPEILGSIVVSIPACHAGDRGSIPRRG